MHRCGTPRGEEKIALILPRFILDRVYITFVGSDFQYVVTNGDLEAESWCRSCRARDPGKSFDPPSSPLLSRA